MAIASVISVLAFFNVFGAYAQAYSAFIALGISFILSPVIAVITKGKYYLAREPVTYGVPATSTLACVSCGYEYESLDMTTCPFHKGNICSLCCSLDSDCHDMCKKPSASPGMTYGVSVV
jgi:hypothetical protein